jgi:hypothetical protein
LIQFARRVRSRGARKLIAAVDAGELRGPQAAKLTAMRKREQVAIRRRLPTDPHAANRAVREIRRDERIDHLRKETSTPLDSSLGKFAVLYADPPWAQEHFTSDSRRIDLNHYPTMGLDELCRLPGRQYRIRRRAVVPLGPATQTRRGHAGDQSLGLRLSDRGKSG